jgi:hypothetical protein
MLICVIAAYEKSDIFDLSRYKSEYNSLYNILCEIRNINLSYNSLAISEKDLIDPEINFTQNCVNIDWSDVGWGRIADFVNTEITFHVL